MAGNAGKWPLLFRRRLATVLVPAKREQQLLLLATTQRLFAAW